MRKIIFILIFILSFSATAQQNSEKLKFRCFDYGVVGIYSDLKTNGIRGVNSNIELSTIYRQNIVSLDLNIGYGITKVGNTIKNLQGFIGANLLYSREYQLSDNIFVEPQTGLGYIIQGNTSNPEDKSSIALPLKLKLKFRTSKKFSIVIMPNANLNNINNIYATNLILQFKL